MMSVSFFMAYRSFWKFWQASTPATIRRLLKPRHPDSRIAQQEAGMATAEVCRKHGLSPASFYKLKAKYGGMELSDAKRLKQLEDENAKLMCLLADTMLDNVVLKDLLGKP